MRRRRTSLRAMSGTSGVITARLTQRASALRRSAVVITRCQIAPGTAMCRAVRRQNTLYRLTPLRRIRHRRQRTRRLSINRRSMNLMQANATLINVGMTNRRATRRRVKRSRVKRSRGHDEHDEPGA